VARPFADSTLRAARQRRALISATFELHPSFAASAMKANFIDSPAQTTPLLY
jgi:hypothetical protein